MRLVKNVCHVEISYMFENGSCWVIKLVTRLNHRRSYACNLLFNAIPHKLEGSSERLQGNHGPLVLEPK